MGPDRAELGLFACGVDAYSGAYRYSSGMATSDSSGTTAAKVAATGPGKWSLSQLEGRQM
jgi:hypothetical protein